MVMKAHWMKKMAAFAVALGMLTAGYPAYAQESSVTALTAQDDITDQVQDWIDHIKGANDYLDAADRFSDTLSDMAARQTYENIRDDLEFLNLAATYCCTIQDHLIVLLTYDESDGPHKDYIQFETAPDASLIYANDLSIWDYMNNEMLCQTCNGSGQIADGNGAACGICGGTGQQYIQNLYYDAAMGWMGGYIGCSGCGGSGYIGMTYHSCPSCSGFGIIF